MTALIIFWLTCGVVTGIVASSKGKNGLGWFFIGSLLGIFGIILIALIPSTVPVPIHLAGNPYDRLRSPDQGLAALGYRSQPSPDTPVDPVKPEYAGYDAKKWQILKEVDVDIAAVSARLALLSSTLDAEFAAKYLTLNDKSYLETIERHLTEKHQSEQNLARESSMRQVAAYIEMLESRGQQDPILLAKVAKVEPYTGRLTLAVGGIKVLMVDGRVLVVNGTFRRRFESKIEVI